MASRGGSGTTQIKVSKFGCGRGIGCCFTFQFLKLLIGTECDLKLPTTYDNHPSTYSWENDLSIESSQSTEVITVKKFERLSHKFAIHWSCASLPVCIYVCIHNVLLKLTISARDYLLIVFHCRTKRLIDKKKQKDKKAKRWWIGLRKHPDALQWTS